MYGDKTYYFSFLLYLAGYHNNLLSYQNGSLLLCTECKTVNKQKAASALAIKSLFINLSKPFFETNAHIPPFCL